MKYQLVISIRREDVGTGKEDFFTLAGESGSVELAYFAYNQLCTAQLPGQGYQGQDFPKRIRVFREGQLISEEQLAADYASFVEKRNKESRERR